LGYPGGPQLAKLAEEGDPERIELPRPMMHRPDLDFSFSGLKTAVLTRLQSAMANGEDDQQLRADLAAATQAAIVDVLVAKSIRALKQTGLKQLVVAGGVGANRRLREALGRKLPRLLCTDNGAMVAALGSLAISSGRPASALGIEAASSISPSIPIWA